jgi:hypothetical protein
MIRIAISQAAYDAISATLLLGSVAYEAEANERGESSSRRRNWDLVYCPRRRSV